VEDALHATRAAVEEGIAAGGGAMPGMGDLEM
jgi:chaperonin GroEL (HSP60 family)